MNTQQKALALNALAEISVRVRRDGSWYVNQAVEVKDGGMLVGEYGNGSTPDEAIADHWQKLTTLEPPTRLVINATSATLRREVRWNGYMWQDVPTVVLGDPRDHDEYDALAEMRRAVGDDD